MQGHGDGPVFIALHKQHHHRVAFADSLGAQHVGDPVAFIAHFGEGKAFFFSSVVDP